MKPLLYAFRTVLTGIHLMRSGMIEANLPALNAEAGLTYLDDLMELKRTGREKEPLPNAPDFYRAEHARLVRQLEQAKDQTHLPSDVPADIQQALSDCVVNTRLTAT